MLLDAGAGDLWVYDEGEWKGGRSEGLAVATFSMFQDGALSSKGQAYVIDGEFKPNCIS